VAKELKEGVPEKKSGFYSGSGRCTCIYRNSETISESMHQNSNFLKFFLCSPRVLRVTLKKEKYDSTALSLSNH
jgi:hypothetical protein